MSLSARIAVERSRRLTFIVASVSAVGVAVAATTLAVRWPACVPLIALPGMAIVATVVLVVRRAERDTGSCLLSIADRTEIDLQRADGTGGPCRLVDSTMSWPGFSMLALGRDDVSRTLHLPVFDIDLTADDRRLLARFLAWSLRGGNATGTVVEAR